MATARSYGHPLPRRATRLEQAEALGGRADTHALASAANAHVFGPDDPGPEEAHAYWQLTNGARGQLRSEADLWKRLRADLDLRPLFARGPAHVTSGTSSTPSSPTRRLRPTRRATAS
jgi:hypothetical protein